MSILCDIHYCSNCKKGVRWECVVYDNKYGSDIGNKPTNQTLYKPKVISAPTAKVHVLCFVCPECGQIDIVKQENRNIHNPYTFR